MTKKKNYLQSLLAIGLLVSGIVIACSVKDDKPATDAPTATHIMYRSIFVEGAVGTYTPKNGATISVSGVSMAMSGDVTITSTEANDVYTITISTTDGTQTLKDIQFTENKVINVSGNNYTQTLDVLSASKATLDNVYLDLSAGVKEITTTDLSIENGDLAIFGVVIATKN